MEAFLARSPSRNAIYYSSSCEFLVTTNASIYLILGYRSKHFLGTTKLLQILKMAIKEAERLRRSYNLFQRKAM